MLKWFRRRRKDLLRPQLVRHLGGEGTNAQTITHPIQPVERVNLQLALDRWFEREAGQARLLGYSAGNTFRNTTLARLLRDQTVSQGPVQWARYPVGPTEELDCVTRGVYLLHHQGQPVVLLLSMPESSLDEPALELMAPERTVVQSAMRQLMDEVNRHAAYKGKVIYLEHQGYAAHRQVLIRFRTLPATPRDAIILPEQVLQVIERNVLGLRKHGEVLRRAGRSMRRGLLFHGPPGTGKTLMLRYLAHACPDYTVVVLTGRQQGTIRESCETARLLAPALVLLEDVDLIGEDRAHNRCPTLLHELMDEMDGLGPQADCVFLLTTNRPEALEPALSARPGRVDQAVEFPLPDEECRRRLFALYGRGLDLGAVELERWIEQTRGVSPAFIEELLRKAALLAAERGETTVPLPLRDDDVEQALGELIYFGGELTQRLLGYRTLGYRTPGARA
jgi:hypothetical protein